MKTFPPPPIKSPSADVRGNPTEPWVQWHQTVAEQLSNSPSYVAVPKSATDSGTAGQAAYDDGYYYLCTANNSWARFKKEAW
jgi:hypothetical protein